MTNKGTLYVVGTPIGNVSDISERAKDILGSADIVAAEDTRRTGILLNKLGIKAKFISFHEHNKTSRASRMIEYLGNGETIALVSDAGMPCISDPGYELVDLCAKEGFDVIVIPGACAAVTALAGSGFSASRFMFEGFLPSRGPERKKRISEIARYGSTCVLYEAPHRLLKTLRELKDESSGGRRICVARELTKKYEEYIRFTIDEAIVHFNSTPPKGEFVIIVEGADHSDIDMTDTEADIMVSDARIRDLLNGGTAARDIVKILAADGKMTRNEIYSMVTDIKKDIQNKGRQK